MIRGFKHRGLKRLYQQGDRGGIGPDLLCGRIGGLSSALRVRMYSTLNWSTTT